MPLVGFHALAGWLAGWPQWNEWQTRLINGIRGRITNLILMVLFTFNISRCGPPALRSHTNRKNRSSRLVHFSRSLDLHKLATELFASWTTVLKSAEECRPKNWQFMRSFITADKASLLQSKWISRAFFNPLQYIKFILTNGNSVLREII